MPSFARLSNHPCPTLQITEKFWTVVVGQRTTSSLWENQRNFDSTELACASWQEQAPNVIMWRILVWCRSSLSHLMDNQSDKPTAYTSHSLSTVEQKYSHLDNEALAILFDVNKFIITCMGGILLSIVTTSYWCTYSTNPRMYQSWNLPNCKGGP